MRHAINKPKRYGVRYPWSTWFSRESFQLRQGKDFEGMTHSMAQQVRNTARRFQVKVSIHFSEDYHSFTVKVHKDQ